MKSIFRKFSLNTTGKLEKENTEIDESSEEPLGILNTVKCQIPKTKFNERQNIEDSNHDMYISNKRKYSVPSKVLTKISIRNLIARKRSTSASRVVGAVEKIDENKVHYVQCSHPFDANEDVKLRCNNVRLRSYECSNRSLNEPPGDVLLLCRRFSELNLPSDHDKTNPLLTPPPFPPLNRISRLSGVSISSYQAMSRRQKRHSLSEFGFGKVESYSKYEILGKGTYSTVFKGQSLLTKDIVALKEVKLEEAEGAPCTAIREISLLRDLRHPNIVTLHDIIYQKNYLTLVFEYLEKNLKQYMEERDNCLEISTIKSFMYQLLSGLDFCHQRRILHRDLKPHNLLINEKHELKLADFGLARAKSIPTKTYSNEVVTLWYRPPDLLLGKTDYSGHIDIWGAGCIFVEMLNGKAIFPGHTEEFQLSLIFEKLGSLTIEEWDSLGLENPRFKFHDFPYIPKPKSFLYLVSSIDNSDNSQLDQLLHGFLHLLGDCRITARQALLYPYFSNSSKKLSDASLPTCDSRSSLVSETNCSPNQSQSISNI